MSQVFLRVLFLFFVMTDSFVSNIEGNSDDEFSQALDDVPTPGASYDPTGNSELDGVRQELNRRRWDEKWISQILAGKKSSHFTFSLSQLMLIKHSH